MVMKKPSEEPELKRRKILIHMEPSITETNPMRIWTVADDLALLTAVAHVQCIRFIHNSLTFSRKFTFSDVEERYCQLMFDEEISKSAKVRLDAMPHRLKAQIEARTPFTRNEERTLMELAENQLKNARKERQDVENHTVLTILHFKKILDGNRQSFHKSRTPQVLSDHYRRIKGYRSEQGNNYNWQALEALTDGNTMDFDINAPLQAARSRYAAISRRPALSGILNRFKTSGSVPDNAIAMINGQFLQYAMTGKSVTMGRASLNEKIDIDLSKEGPATKVSRQQAVICHVADDKFTIQNVGQRIMYVDSKPLPQMVTTSLKNGSIIEIVSLRLVFSIPVPRILHPITRQCALQHKKVQQEQQRSLYGTPQGPPPPPKKPRGKVAGGPPGIVQKVVRRVDSGGSDF